MRYARNVHQLAPAPAAPLRHFPQRCATPPRATCTQRRHELRATQTTTTQTTIFATDATWHATPHTPRHATQYYTTPQPVPTPQLCIHRIMPSPPPSFMTSTPVPVSATSIAGPVTSRPHPQLSNCRRLSLPILGYKFAIARAHSLPPLSIHHESQAAHGLSSDAHAQEGHRHRSTGHLLPDGRATRADASASVVDSAAESLPSAGGTPNSSNMEAHKQSEQPSKKRWGTE